ncbi:hypothetical protein E1B28_003325 [Marasmius oreades]|uniref:Uncharacterized protein n=1 Tax=Marasmius oreades TaxID=181124 RepID=A0A9P7RLD1_9AGAR|nr:uncharacterized protein E1B28_003325 [Marasmius oreades]KAG7085784.1 hypothetical protein E1B28_003325 [Marasmius oreades]
MHIPNIICSAKSGGDWTQNELDAFNIHVVVEDMATFFGSPNLPAPTVDPIILTDLYTPSGPLTKSTRLFFRYLGDIIGSFPYSSAIVTFTSHLLGLLGYDEPDRVLHHQTEIRFIMCGARVEAKPDICLLDSDDEYILLVQEDKRRRSTENPESQLIAGAIAAFHENDRRRSLLGLPAAQAKTFVGITIFSTVPTFYKIPITSDLLRSVRTGQFPPQQTVVHKLITPFPFRKTYRNGMHPLENRRIVLQCFEALKRFV